MSEDLTKEIALQSSQIAQILSLAQETKAHLNSVDQRLTALELKFEERVYDTRPLWERVVGEIENLRLGQEKLSAGQEELRAELAAFRAETDRNLKKIDKRFEYVFGSIGDLRAQFDILEERVNKLAPET